MIRSPMNSLEEPLRYGMFSRGQQARAPLDFDASRPPTSRASSCVESPKATRACAHWGIGYRQGNPAAMSLRRVSAGLTCLAASEPSVACCGCANVFQRVCRERCAGKDIKSSWVRAADQEVVSGSGSNRRSATSLVSSLVLCNEREMNFDIG